MRKIVQEKMCHVDIFSINSRHDNKILFSFENTVNVNAFFLNFNTDTFYIGLYLLPSTV